MLPEAETVGYQEEVHLGGGKQTNSWKEAHTSGI
jgi:hypothetical protein